MLSSKILPFLFVATLLAGCAPLTRDIAPAAVDDSAYAEMQCAQLEKARSQTGLKLVFSGLRQDQIANDDNIRTLGVPSMFGTVFEGGDEEQIAKIKGELRAINAAARKRCGAP